MSIVDSLIQKFFKSSISFGDFQIINISRLTKPIEFENYSLTLIDENGNYFGNSLISKRLITAYAQDLLLKKNILLIPDFVDAAAIMLLSDILNKIDEKYKICLEISPLQPPEDLLTTDLLLGVKYKKIFSPLILKIDTEQIFQIMLKNDIQIEDNVECLVSINGTRHLPLCIIGALKENGLIKLPVENVVIINDYYRLSKFNLSIEEEKMEENILSIDELRLPVTIRIELGNLRYVDIKEFLKGDDKIKLLQNRQCKIFLGNSLIATGEIYENQVRVTKVFI